MSNPENSVYDVEIMTERTVHLEADAVLLKAAVATKRLYLLNDRGEYELVIFTSYWRGGNIYSTCSDGYEFDENGTVTRDWR